MTGYHTRWAGPREAADDPERIAIREALAFGKALYDIRTALGLSVAELTYASPADTTSAPSGSKATPPNHPLGDTALVRAGTADLLGRRNRRPHQLRQTEQADLGLSLGLARIGDVLFCR
jgi:hypothetical protein